MSVSLRLPLLLTGIALLCTNCHKSSDPTPPIQPSRVELLTQHAWRESAATYTVTENGITTTRDIYAQLPACRRDNFTKYNVDRSYTNDEGATLCDPADPQVRTSTWDFFSNESEFVYAPNSPFTILYQIKTLNATTFSIERSSTAQGRTETYAYTLTAI